MPTGRHPDPIVLYGEFAMSFKQILKKKQNFFSDELLLDLMLETMIAEAVLPVVATGFFGNLSGLDFLKMIRRKANWLNKNRKKLTQAMNP